MLSLFGDWVRVKTVVYHPIRPGPKSPQEFGHSFMVANPSRSPTELKSSPSQYEQDYLIWLEQTVRQLESHVFSELDLENLIEEISDLGKSHKNAAASYLMRICEHLLKIKYWDSEREHCYPGWRREIRNFRIELHKLLQNSPSLKRFLESEFNTQYRHGRDLFLDASNLPAALVPEQPEFTLDQALDADWLPI